jgi:hypothetical protein
MHFGARDLKPYAEPVPAGELKEGEIYFSVNYIDDDMLIPIMETLVFVGRNLEPEDSGELYFQDIASYRRGVRLSTATKDDYARFILEPEKKPWVFHYEQALELLMQCSLRRQGMSDG